VIERVVASCVTGLARLVTGVRANWVGCVPDPRPRVYFANHTSHGDFVLIWSVLPGGLRAITRPVAAADYWLRGRLRRFFGERVFRAVLFDRTGSMRDADPIGRMAAAIDARGSLIIFPEGTRNTGSEPLQSFKAGIYHLAKARPDVEFVPVWIENLNRVMPKGEFFPVPLLCTVTFGAPIQLGAEEKKHDFIARCRDSLLAVMPKRA
jgi:1-acyl-sn-glycerol-3-phosphate acyltransferase